MYFFAFMVGSAHYGLPVGRKFHKGTPGDDIFTRKTLKSWIEYALPKPYFITGGHRENYKTTCLVCLVLFALAPGLRRIPAFNKGGACWAGHDNGPEGVLCITYLHPTGDDVIGEDLLLLTSPQEKQKALRLKFIEQELKLSGARVEFSGEVSSIPGRGAVFQKDDFTDDDVPEVPVRPSNWWS
jgi:hypothetical protein